MDDRLDILSRQLIQNLDERRKSLGPECLSDVRIEAYLEGDLTADEWEKDDFHMESCLSCLHAKVEFENLLAGAAESLAVPDAPSREKIDLNTTFQEFHMEKRLLESTRSVPSGGRRKLSPLNPWHTRFKWGVAGALVGSILVVLAQPMIQNSSLFRGITIGRTVNFQQEKLDTITPLKVQTVTGTVSEIKQEKKEGRQHYLFKVNGYDGNTYLISSWGDKNIRLNDQLEIDASLSRDSYEKYLDFKLKTPSGENYFGFAYRISKLN